MKSLREGRATLADAFATVDDGGLAARRAHPQDSHGTWTNHTPRPPASCCCTAGRSQTRSPAELETKGSTLCRLAIYFTDDGRKVQTAIATGKREYDKRQSIAQREKVQSAGAAGPGGYRIPAGADEHGHARSRSLWPGLLLAVGFAGHHHRVGGLGPVEFSIEYEMGTDGVLQAKETIRCPGFGSDSGRHGIDRYFVTRELYDDQQDAVYTVDVKFGHQSGLRVATQYSEIPPDRRRPR